jgi:hypothetical protein
MSSKPWNPSLNGEALPPCRWHDEVVTAGYVPEGPWSRKTVMPLLAATPDPVEIWNSVLALWRLRRCEERGAEDQVWMSHLKAWLVRRGSCLSSLISLTLLLARFAMIR